MAGQLFGRDYKTIFVERERQRQRSSTVNWIYVGADTQRCDMAKIGLTTGSLATRASGSQNPFYALFCAFKVKEGVDSKRVSYIEAAVKNHLTRFYECIPHTISGRPSEWFYVTPQEMRESVSYFLAENFSFEMYCYYCHIRGEDIIYSWENPDFLQGSLRPRYQARDLTTIPVDPNCYMPGGCGADCDCWD